MIGWGPTKRKPW